MSLYNMSGYKVSNTLERIRKFIYYNIRMNKVTNIFDSITVCASIFGVYVSVQDVQSYLSIACTVICLISGLVTLLLRVLAMFKKYTSEDSDGGSKLTKEEIEDIANTIDTGVEKLTNKENKEDSK